MTDPINLTQLREWAEWKRDHFHQATTPTELDRAEAVLALIDAVQLQHEHDTFGQRCKRPHAWNGEELDAWLAIGRRKDEAFSRFDWSTDA